MVIDSTSISFPVLRGQRVGPKSLTLLVTGFVPLATNPPPPVIEELSKNHLININSGVVENKRHAFHFYYSGSISGTGNKV